MNPYTYSEDSLVEQPATQLSEAMGWQTVSALDEVFGTGGTLGRETKGEPAPLPRLRTAPKRLNPSFPSEAILPVIDQLNRDRLAMSLVVANWGAYCFLKEGSPASNRDAMLLCQVALSSDFHAVS